MVKSRKQYKNPFLQVKYSKFALPLRLKTGKTAKTDPPGDPLGTPPAPIIKA